MTTASPNPGSLEPGAAHPGRSRVGGGLVDAVVVIDGRGEILRASELSARMRRLEDLLANLVRNAAEARPNGGRLRLAASAEGRHTVRLIVEGGGPAIPLAEREEMFRLFRTTQPDGTGLGLALARKIVEEHEATITLGDAYGGGLRIFLDWPAAARLEPEPLPAR